MIFCQTDSLSLLYILFARELRINEVAYGELRKGWSQVYSSKHLKSKELDVLLQTVNG